MEPTPYLAQSRPRTVERIVTLTEWRCVVCGRWQTGRLPRLSCSGRCRAALARMRQRGETPPYAVLPVGTGPDPYAPTPEPDRAPLGEGDGAEIAESRDPGPGIVSEGGGPG